MSSGPVSLVSEVMPMQFPMGFGGHGYDFIDTICGTPKMGPQERA